MRYSHIRFFFVPRLLLPPRERDTNHQEKCETRYKSGAETSVRKKKKNKKSYLTDEKWYDKQAHASKQVKNHERNY